MAEVDVRTRRLKEVQRRLKKVLQARQRGARVIKVMKMGLKPAAFFRSQGERPDTKAGVHVVQTLQSGFARTTRRQGQSVAARLLGGRPWA